MQPQEPGLSPDGASSAYTASAGNPLLLEHLAGAAAEADGERHGVAVSDLSLDALVLGRFAALPDAGVLCARAAAVLGVRFRPDLAVALAGLDEDGAEVALEALSHSGLVRPVGGGLAEFAHPLVLQSLYDDLPPLVRDALHGPRLPAPPRTRPRG